MITYGSICSGIESASIAWEPLGMRPLWFSEIEKFPSAVLKYHWSNIVNLGDMCELPNMTATGLIQTPDILVGGTPCQAFSVAGLRKGLDDERGQLTLKYVELLNEIDKKRIGDECVAVWENVPGVLNTKDNAFGHFLAALAGETSELIPSGKKWTNAGCVFGPKRTIAWRVLDAQYFGVAQRRRRVFVVASARNGFNPAAVLFESDGLRRDTSPSRETKPNITEPITNGLDKGRVARCLRATQGRLDHDAETFVTGYDSFQHHNWRESDTFNTLTANLSRGVCGDTPLVTNIQVTPIHDKTTRHAGKTGKGSGNGFGIGKTTDPMFTLTTGDKHAVHYGCSIRKLTPVECERLQGFPDNHTCIPYNNKLANKCPIGPRLKALGNSKAVPVVRWVGQRIIKELKHSG